MMRRFAIALTLLCATGCVSLARAQAAAAPAAQTEAPAGESERANRLLLRLSDSLN